MGVPTSTDISLILPRRDGTSLLYSTTPTPRTADPSTPIQSIRVDAPPAQCRNTRPHAAATCSLSGTASPSSVARHSTGPWPSRPPPARHRCKLPLSLPTLLRTPDLSVFFFLMIRPPPKSPLFPSAPLSR